MKTIYFLVFLLGIHIIACRKDNNSASKTAEEQFIAALKASVYKNNASGTILNKPPKLVSAVIKVIKVIGADVGGFLNGANTATNLAKNLGLNPLDHKNEIIAAGTAVGAGASAAAGSIVAPGGNGWNGQTGSGITVPGNIQNPYLLAGIQHNQGLDIYAGNFAAWLNGQNANLPAIGQIAQAQLMPMFSAYTYPQQMDECNAALNLIYNNLNDDQDLLFGLLEQQGMITSLMYTTFTLYFDTIGEADSSQDVYNITSNFENIVLSSSLDEMDKATLLSGLAVARYSFGYWSSVVP